MMKLYLVQHGEAVSKEMDPERPLSERGRADVQRLARLMQADGIRVDRVIHSGKQRAAQTARILAQVMAPDVVLQVSENINPNDNVKVFDWQRECNNRDLLAVGHLPFMAKLASHLLSHDENIVPVAFSPGSMVCLEYLGETGWQLDWMLRPELLVHQRASHDEME